MGNGEKVLITTDFFYIAQTVGRLEGFVVESTSHYASGVSDYMEEYHSDVEYKILKIKG